MAYKSIHTGQQIDAGVSAALNPDTVPTAGSDALITSGGTKSAITKVETDLASIRATGTTNTTGSAIAIETRFYLNNVLVRAKADIDIGATFTYGTNYETVTAGALNPTATTNNLVSEGSSIVYAYWTYTVTFVNHFALVSLAIGINGSQNPNWTTILHLPSNAPLPVSQMEILAGKNNVLGIQLTTTGDLKVSLGNDYNGVLAVQISYIY